jgi:hypothetical protein
MVATASIKMDELLATWLGSDTIYENVLRIIESQKESCNNCSGGKHDGVGSGSAGGVGAGAGGGGVAPTLEDGRPPLSPKVSPKKVQKIEIPPFYKPPRPSSATSSSGGGVDEGGNPQNPPPQPPKRRMSSSFAEDQTWNGDFMSLTNVAAVGEESPKSNEEDSITDNTVTSGATGGNAAANQKRKVCIAQQAKELFLELGIQFNDIADPQIATALQKQYLHNAHDTYHSSQEDLTFIPLERFERITKELCNLPTFFHKPLYERILMLWSTHYHLSINNGDKSSTSSNQQSNLPPVVTYGIFHHYWSMEMAPFDKNERFFRLLKQPEVEFITRDDFFPYIKELLNDHPVSCCCVCVGCCVGWEMGD